MRVAFAFVRVFIRIGWFGIGFIIRMRLSARVYRRKLVRSGVPRAHADLLYRDFRATGIGAILNRHRTPLASKSTFAVGSEKRRQE